MKILAWFVLAASVSSTLVGCGGGCPKPSAPPASRAEWEAGLVKKRILPLLPEADIAIKRDVHTLVVDVPANVFAKAFHEVMMDPSRRFGLIQVDRRAMDVGKPFAKGQRFQGRYSFAGALKEQLCADSDRALDDVLEGPALAAIVCAIENDAMSDYGEISELVLAPEDAPEFRFAYRYLEGSPIAGSSTFSVADIGEGKSRVTQIFEYQEQNQSFAVFFSNRGLKLHNQVVFSQVTQSAAKAGGRVVSSDIPARYQEG